MKIVYLQDNGIAALVTPITTAINPSTGNLFTIEEIAKKDVPSGYKYKIIEDSDVPVERAFRDAWVVKESDLTDGTGEG